MLRGVLFHFHLRRDQAGQNREKMTYRQIFEAAREAGHEWADAALENCYQFGTAEDERRKYRGKKD